MTRKTTSVRVSDETRIALLNLRSSEQMTIDSVIQMLLDFKPHELPKLKCSEKLKDLGRKAQAKEEKDDLKEKILQNEVDFQRRENDRVELKKYDARD